MPEQLLLNLQCESANGELLNFLYSLIRSFTSMARPQFGRLVLKPFPG